MSNSIQLSADSRTEFGKGAARRLRRDHKVPAVIYGHGGDPVHIALPGHETLLALRTANALLAIRIDGGQEQLALPKQVQRDPIKGFLEHVDLLIVKRGEVPLVVVGEVKEGIVMMDLNTLAIEAEATNIPAQIEIDVASMVVGHQVTAGDLALPEGSELIGEPTHLILSVAAPITEEALEASLESEGDEGAAPAEGEGDAGDDSE